MRPPKKHLIFVHGRSTKPAEKEKERLVRTALLRGIERTDPESADQIRSGHVRFTMAYFGDVNNRIMRRSGTRPWKWMTKKDPDHGNALCEDGIYYDDSLREALGRPSDAFTKTDYKRWLGDVKDMRIADDVARIVSGVASFFGLSDEFMERGGADMVAYLTRRTVASEVRTRLQEPLKLALRSGEDVCLMSHSMGCIVAYDVLWKFSRMSEYRELRGAKVPLWLTLGNPLGEPGVRKNLYDAREPEDSQFPEDIVDTWVNMSAYDDFICHDATMADDFRDMVRRGYIRRIHDRPKIYSFWRGGRGANPHKLYGYLNHPDVGAEIAAWIRSERPRS